MMSLGWWSEMISSRVAVDSEESRRRELAE